MKIAVAAVLLAAFPQVASATRLNLRPGIHVAPIAVKRDSVSSAATKASTYASARIDSCVKSSVIGSRAFVIRADMYKVAGATSMRVRFHAFRTLPGEAETELKLGGSDRLGYWENPVSAGSGAVSHLIFYKRLYSLDAPATFRATVDYEWQGSGGKVIRTQSVRLGTCVQPDLRPDLVVDRVTVAAIPGDSTKLRYRVTVSNRGKGRSAPSRLNVRVPVGSALKTFTPASAAGAELLVGSIDETGSKRKATRTDPLVFTRTVLVDAAKCTSGNAVIEIDPGNALDESSTDNNVYAVAVDCSVPTPVG